MTPTQITKELQDNLIDRLARTPIEFHSTTEVAQLRQDTCNACPEKTLYFDVEQCRACGCFVELKVKLNNSRCPLNKWEVIFIQGEVIAPRPGELPYIPPLPEGIEPIVPPSDVL